MYGVVVDFDHRLSMVNDVEFVNEVYIPLLLEKSTVYVTSRVQA